MRSRAGAAVPAVLLSLISSFAVSTALAPLSPTRFRRANDFLQNGAEATSREVVNVLGRWKTQFEWDSIGVAKEMDALDPSDYKPWKKLTKEEQRELTPARTPQRRDFCKRYGQVQRWIHNENVALLPFISDEMAASVGATAEELNAEPISELAAEIVFDALSVSQSGIVAKDDCDARRASYETDEGKFNEAAFLEDLATAKRNILIAYAFFPGTIYALQLYIFIRVDGYHQFLDWANTFVTTLASQYSS